MITLKTVDRNGMKTFTKFIDKSNIVLSDSLFFDIETTGLSHSNSIVFLIGIMYYDEDKNGYVLIQNIIYKMSEERLILEDFIRRIKPFKRIISFNGTSFDIPFIKGRCARYGIMHDINDKIHLDLYLELRPLKKLLGLDDFKLSSASKAAGFDRIDNTSGREVIELFHEYVKEASLCRVTGIESETLRKLCASLLLHNSDDVEAYIYVYALKAYKDILEQKFFDIKTNETDSEVSLTAGIELYFPKELYFSDEYSSLLLCDKSITVSLKKTERCLKIYYKDYKNYYYLPDEDMSIHKSLALYVDKEHREKAHKENCYSKREDIFIATYEELDEEAFKYGYDDGIYFAPVAKVMKADEEWLKKLMAAVFRHYFKL